MGQYAKHVFVCAYGPWCRRDGDTDAIIKRLKRGVAEAGLTGTVRINRAGCFNQCGHGPMVRRCDPRRHRRARRRGPSQ